MNLTFFEQRSQMDQICPILTILPSVHMKSHDCQKLYIFIGEFLANPYF
jgi:hypothetical protein